MKKYLLVLLSGFALAGCATPAKHNSNTAIPAGSRYVAMGSSYAAGPGVTTPAETPTTRCSRSSDNYAHQLTRKRNLTLVDVSCSGATTDHLLGPWNELPPQLDAVNSDTKLVTITIGGNDVGFVSGLFASSCEGAASNPNIVPPPICRAMAESQSPAAAQARAQMNAPMDEAKWQTLAKHFDQIITDVHRKAPSARLIFVDYLTVVPERKFCDSVPLTTDGATIARTLAKRLKQLTADAAKRGGAEILAASDMSKTHDACAKTAWITGFIVPAGSKGFTPYHPNLTGMTAIAEALDTRLGF